MRVRPFQVSWCDDVPEGLTTWGYQPGFQISYLVEGQNIVALDSFVIETIKTPEGVDISKYWNGKPAYYTTKGQPSPDGKCCVFALTLGKIQPRKTERLAITGHVTILFATKREEKRIDLKLTDEQETKVGPFSVRINANLSATPSAPQPTIYYPQPTIYYPPPAIAPHPVRPPTTSATIPYAAPTPYSIPFAAAPTGIYNNVPAMGVSITGPLNSLIEAKFHDGDQELQGPLQLGPMYSVGENTRMYSLPKPKANKVTVTLSYWLDLAKVTLPIVP